MSDTGTRVLVVEDSAPTRAVVTRSLEADGLVVTGVGTAEAARRHLERAETDVVVLDLMLPDASGFGLLREVLATTGVPVVVLSSRGEETDRVLGLELGAEDYVVKPFYPRELATRVRRAAERGQSTGRALLEYGELVIDLERRVVTVAGAEAALTNREFDLLAHLARHPGRVFSRQELLVDVWDSSAEWQTDATVTEHVRRLRHKVEPDPAKPRMIITVAGAGYRFDP